MKNMLVVLLLTVLATIVAGQNNLCRNCNQGFFNGEPYNNNDCYDNVSNTFSTKCPGSFSVPYCYSTFTIKDGLVTSVSRGCADAADDNIDSSDVIDTSRDKCATTFGSSTETTTCLHMCPSDNCNTVSADSLQSCSSNCSAYDSQGYCDYFTGNCVCNAGFTGNDCSAATQSTPTFRSCVQCNEETYPDCENLRGGSLCAKSSDQFCTSTYTTLFDTEDAVVRTRISRGCTSELNYRDECFFSSPTGDLTGDWTGDWRKFAGYKEYTCISTCATDDCNINTPNGLLDGAEVQALYCMQCSDASDSSLCATSRSPLALCPASSTHCYSRAAYYTSEREDRSENSTSPEYRFLSIERGCGTTALTKQCTTTALGSTSANKVVCEESCQTDGCNVGWPNRPMCSVCSSSSSASNDGYDECLFNPPAPEQCSWPYQRFCIYVDHGKENALTGQVSHDRNGYSRLILRGCSHFTIGNRCSVSTVDQTEFRTCNKTCTITGCNQGMRGSAIKPVQHFLMILLPSFIGFALQQKISN